MDEESTPRLLVRISFAPKRMDPSKYTPSPQMGVSFDWCPNVLRLASLLEPPTKGHQLQIQIHPESSQPYVNKTRCFCSPTTNEQNQQNKNTNKNEQQQTKTNNSKQQRKTTNNNEKQRTNKKNCLQNRPPDKSPVPRPRPCWAAWGAWSPTTARRCSPARRRSWRPREGGKTPWRSRLAQKLQGSWSKMLCVSFFFQLFYLFPVFLGVLRRFSLLLGGSSLFHYLSFSGVVRYFSLLFAAVRCLLFFVVVFFFLCVCVGSVHL